MATGGTDPSIGTLRGRTGEFDVLEKRITALTNHRGGMVLIDGPPGIGKSRLLDEAIARAVDHGVPVAVARADRQEQMMPLSLLRKAIGESVLTSPSSVADNRLWLIDGILVELEQRAARSPLMVALDDLQWADEATLAAVQRLAPQLSSYPVLWTLAGRSDDAGTPLDSAFGHLEEFPWADRIRLGPLPDDAVCQLLTDVVGAQPAADLVALARRMDGNPLVLLELTEGLQGDGGIDVIDGEARLVSVPIAPRSEDILARRLSRVSREARHLLEVAAVLGRTFSVADVAEIMGEPVGGLLPALGEALGAGVLVPAGDVLAFRHNVVHQTVYQAIPGPVRLALHRQIGGLLLNRGPSAVPAAGHLITATMPGDREALIGLDQAIHEVVALSPHAAADLALRALELTDPTDDGRFDRAVTTVESLMAATRLHEATDLARTTLEMRGLPAVTAARLRLTLSSILFMQGQTSRALKQAEAVLSEPVVAGELHARAELARLLGLMAQDDWPKVRQPAEAILAGSNGYGADAALAAALTALAFIAWDEGQVADALGHLRAAVHRSDRAPAEARHNYPRLSLANMLTAIGEFEEAEREIRKCREEIDLLGDTLWIAAPAIPAARLHLASGRLDDARAEAEVGLAIAEEFGTRFFVPMMGWVLAGIAIVRGDLNEAARQVERYERQLPAIREGLLASVVYTWMAFRLADAQEGAAPAIDVLRLIFDDLAGHKRLFVEEPAAAAWLTRAALALGDRERAAQVVTCAEQLAAANRSFPSINAAAVHARGVFARDHVLLQQAAADHRHPWARASASEDAGVVLADGGNGKAARAQLEKALASYEETGATRDTDRLRKRLRTLGIRRHKSPRAERPVTGWASLTNTEQSVADLVAEGLTNPQVAGRMFLSRHTVDFHLRQIFRKLAIGSRVELTRLALTRGTNAP